MELFLRSVSYEPDSEHHGFPFDLPLLQTGPCLELRAPVTFLAGENGSGKSTLLEATACALGCIAIGEQSLDSDPTLAPARRLGAELSLVRNRPPRNTAFFRAEDAFGFNRRIGSETRDLLDLEAEFEETFTDGSWAQRLAVGTVRGQRRALESTYGEDPDARSHGESFLHVLQQRLTPRGLYLLDEPETPLSPLRQLGLLHQLRTSCAQGSQFLIASHSPILMAFPGAQIYWLDGCAEEIAWDDLEHVQLTRSFLNRPQDYLRRLEP